MGCTIIPLFLMISALKALTSAADTLTITPGILYIMRIRAIPINANREANRFNLENENPKIMK